MRRFLRTGLGSNLTLLFSFILWAISMFLVFEDNYATDTVAGLADIPIDKFQDSEFQNWMDVKLSGEKIGYTMRSVGTTPLGFILKDYSLIKLPMGGTIREVYLDSYAVLNADYSLKSFTFGLVSGDYTTDLFGEVRKGKLFIKARSQNSETSVTFDAEDGIYLPAVIPMMARVREFPMGRFRLPTFDPFSLITNELEVSIENQEEINTSFGPRKSHRMEITFSGVSSLMWVDSDGMILREEETGGMEMVAVSKEKALDMPYISESGKDILLDLAVPCAGEITDPRNADYLKVMIEGIKPEFFDLDDDFQTVLSVDPLILEIHTGRIRHSELKNAEQFLSAQTFIQSEDPRIKSASSNITGPESDVKSRSEALGKWVYENIEKDYAVSLPSAVDVLLVKKGDCNEHTSLYTALSRAAGIPTKVCIGIVYKDGLFYYHAWPAVYDDGWRPMDPTFGQSTADATHIKIIEGGFERQADLMRVVGRLSVTILETSESENPEL